MRDNLIIAIDGPAGAGKSTVARELALRLGYTYIDTGAMYRTLALKLVKEGARQDEESVRALLPKTTTRFEGGDGGFRCLLDGEDVTQEIRSPEVSEAASVISCYRPIREMMVEMQRALGRKGDSILEGRDIGTVVFPDADLKVFLDAAPCARAKRRLKDVQDQGKATTLEETLREIQVRDERDQGREHSPLTQAQDALCLDTTRMSFDAVVAYLYSVIQERIRCREKITRG